MIVMVFLHYAYTDLQPVDYLNFEQRLNNLENSLFNMTEELLLQKDARKKLEKEIALEKIQRQAMERDIASERALVQRLEKELEENQKSDNEAMQQMLLLKRKNNQSLESNLQDLERSRSWLNETFQSVIDQLLANVSNTIKNTKIEIVQERNERKKCIGDLNHTVFSLQSAIPSMYSVLVSKYTLTH